MAKFIQVEQTDGSVAAVNADYIVSFKATELNKGQGVFAKKVEGTVIILSDESVMETYMSYDDLSKLVGIE